MPKNAKRTSQRKIRTNNRHMHEIADQSWRIIHERNEPPRLFSHSDMIARLVTKDGQVTIYDLNKVAFKDYLDRSANYCRYREKKQVPSKPPTDVVEGMMETSPLPLPRLDAVIETPIYSKGGKLSTKIGYQPETFSFYYPQPGFDIPKVSASPNQPEIDMAVELILDGLYHDFPFTEPADMANAVGALLLPFVRLMISGPTPLHLIESPTPGTGKGLLAQAITVPSIPTSLTTLPEGQNDDEWRKRITSTLMYGPACILIDNLKSELQSSALAAVLTTENWEDRILGHSRNVILPVRCLWLATGNNPQLSLEIARRTVSIRLDSSEERPWERSGFRYPNIVEWARNRRPFLTWAALTLIQSWASNGMPAGQEIMGSYESWARIVGGILDCANISGFLGNRERTYSEVEEEVIEWEQFCIVWWKQYPREKVTASVLLELAIENQLLTDIWMERAESGAKSRLGKRLSKMNDRVIGRFKVKRSNNDHAKGSVYHLELQPLRAGDAGDAGDILASCESIRIPNKPKVVGKPPASPASPA